MKETRPADYPKLQNYEPTRFMLDTSHYGTNRVATYLNERGIKTKRGTTLWRGTSVRAIIANPIYKRCPAFW